VPVTEIDGAACRDIFTVLNQTHFYAADQIYNFTAFSVAYAWIYALYLKPSSTDESGGLFSPTTAAAAAPSPSLGTPAPPKMDDKLKEALVKYCTRLFDQSRLKSPTSGENQHRRLPDTALHEALRILDGLSCLDPSLVRPSHPQC